MVDQLPSDNPPASRRLPWWVDTLDVVTLVAAVAVLPALMGGRTRFHLGPVVVSLGSPWRSLLYAVAAFSARHLMRRQPTLLARARLWFETGLAACPTAIRVAVKPFVFSRLAVLFVGYFSVMALGYPAGQRFDRAFELRNLPVKYDANYYLEIARNGYRWAADPTHHDVFAFFPAYPMIARLVGWLVGGAEAGLFLVALASFFLALTYFFSLAREHLDADRAETALLLLAFYPFAVFYSADYTEALFLLASVGAFYHFRRAEWWRASAWGVLAGLTRPNGCLVSVALGVLILERAWHEYRSGALIFAQWRRWLAAVFAASSPIFGLAVHAARVYVLTGDPFTWLSIQHLWGREYHSPAVLLDWLREALSFGFYGYAMRSPLAAFQSLAVLIAIISIWPVARRFGTAYGVFILVNLLPPLINGGTLSMGRFTSTLFPMFLWLAAVVPPERRTACVSSFGIVQGFVATVFFTCRGLA